MDLPSRVRLYLDRCPPAVSGSSGHNQTFTVACALVHGFSLSENEAFYFLSEYNRRCQPQWSEKELWHKVKSALNAAHTKPRGHLIGANGHAEYKPEDFRCYSTPKPEPKAKKPSYTIDKPTALPDPLEDQTRRFLMSVFCAGEAVSISEARLNEEGRCVPKGGGVTYSREEWIKKLDAAAGDPNKIFSPGDGGAFIRINPMKMGGSKDSDVIAFRHALIEFDHCSVEEQWNLITQSGIPCSAVLHSGNKSLHAWVKVDAKDRTEYTLRVKTLYDHFKEYGIDDKNKNPSRFSRLPGVLRGKKKQDLLALNVGALSFDQWLIDKEADGIGKHITIEDLLKFKPEDDPNCVVGNRWLCRGGSCLWVGQSGVGKSALAMQAAISWGTGLDFFGIGSKGKLKSLFIQAENDEGDLAEMFNGVVNGMGNELVKHYDNPSDIIALLKQNLIIIRDQVHTGFEFTVAIQRLIEKHRPDLVWIDPLLSFIGDDVSSQKVCSEFLRNWLNPISEATGVIWMMLHHTGKPLSDSKARKGWTSTDYSYLGTGSSELVNWARAVNIIKRVDEDTFQMMLAKRGRRAGAVDLTKVYTNDIYMRHSDSGICWVQADPPMQDEDEGEKHKRGRPRKDFDYDGFLASIKNTGYFTATQLTAKAAKYSNMSDQTIWKKVLPEIKTRMTYDPDHQTYSF